MTSCAVVPLWTYLITKVTILGKKIGRKTPVHFEIKNEADQGPKCTFFFILNLGGVEGWKKTQKFYFFLGCKHGQNKLNTFVPHCLNAKLCYCTQVKPCMMMILTGITRINDIIVISSDHNTNDVPSTWQGIRDACGSTRLSNNIRFVHFIVHKLEIRMKMYKFLFTNKQFCLY